MQLIYLLFLGSATYGLGLSLTSFMGIKFVGLIYMDAAIILAACYALVGAPVRPSLFLMIISYMALGLLLVAINLSNAAEVDGSTIIRYTSFYRRTVLPFILVFLFVKELNSLQRLERLDRFLFKLLMTVSFIQIVDFVLFQFEWYNQAYRHLMALQASPFEKLNPTDENAFYRDLFGIQFNRANGFMLDMYASNFFCIFIYAYLRLSGTRFTLLQKIYVSFACITGLSLLFFMCMGLLEFVAFFTFRQKAGDVFAMKKWLKKAKWLSRAVNAAPFLLALATGASIFIYLRQGGNPFFDKFFQEFVMIMLRNIAEFSLESTRGILFGYGGLHLLDLEDVRDNIMLLTSTDIAFLVLIMEGGAINFFALLAILVLPALYYERKYRKVLILNQRHYRLFMAGKFVVLLGILTWLHQLAMWSRQVVVVYMMCYAMIFVSINLMRKNQGRTQ